MLLYFQSRSQDGNYIKTSEVVHIGLTVCYENEKCRFGNGYEPKVEEIGESMKKLQRETLELFDQELLFPIQKQLEDSSFGKVLLSCKTAALTGTQVLLLSHAMNNEFVKNRRGHL